MNFVFHETVYLDFFMLFCTILSPKALYCCAWIRKRLDATLQDLEEKQNSKKEAVGSLAIIVSCSLFLYHLSSIFYSSWLMNITSH